MKRSAPSAPPKITPPRLAGVVDRARLIRRIQEAQAPTVWISGAPGAGKSTLAASYLQVTGVPALWYQVDAADADAATLFHYLDMAAVRRGLLRGATLPRLSGNATVDLPRFAQRYFRTLFARLSAPSAVVFDNAQEALGSSFAIALRCAIEEAPVGHRIIVLSLADPPDVLARALANRRVEVVAPEELAFTADEARQVIGGHAQLDAGVCNSIVERAGGWAAGLILMAEHARRAGSPGEPPPVAGPEAVFDYFAGEILARMDARDQRTLMLTAALPRVTARLAATMSGEADAQRLLEHLYRHHLFIDRRPEPELTYRYHGLFRAFLLARAHRQLPAAERTGALARTAALVEAEGEREEAILLYLAAGCWREAIPLILRQAPGMHEQGRWRTLQEWIAAIPPELVASHPWIAYWRGACDAFADPARARAELAQAFAVFASAGDREGQILAAGALSRAHILTSDWAPLDRWIAELATLLSGDCAGLPASTLVTGLSRLLYATFVRQPRHPELPRIAQRVLAQMQVDAPVNDVVMAGYSLMQYHHLTGEVAAQEAVVRRIDPLLADPELSAVSRCYWLWAHANHVERTGSPRAALALLESSLDVAVTHGLAIAAVVRRYRIASLLTLGELNAAAAALTALEATPRVEPYYEMKAWLLLLRGDPHGARREAATALQMASERGRTYYRILNHFLLAIAHADADEPEAARACLARFRAETEGIAGALHRYLALLVDAYLALQAGDHDACHAPLGAALAIGERERYRSHWIWHPKMMARLYAEALARNLHAEYARSVVRSHGLAPPHADVEHWPWRLSIRTLGAFELHRDGELLRFEGKTQRRPLDLVKVLVALGGRDVPAATLVDLLWPQPLEDGGRKALDITIHRLRRLAGSDAVVEVADHRVSLNRNAVAVDAWTLEALLPPLAVATGAAEPDLARQDALAPRILALYQGHFLPDDGDAPWLIPLRNRLAGRFQRWALQIGSHWEARAEWARALALYQRVNELDPLAEAFYRRQMVCLHALGERAEAMAVFRHCRQTLSVVLGVAPTAATEAAYRALLAP